MYTCTRYIFFLQEKGNIEDVEAAANLFLKCGETEKALHMSKSNKKLTSLAANIHLIMARRNLSQHGHPDVTKVHLAKAKTIYTGN